MQREHREAIQRCFSTLVEQTDLDLMVAVLYEKGVFSEAMIEPYKDTSKDTRSRKRQLYRDLTRRGPHAFRHLLDALSENGYWDIVRDLDPTSALHPRPIPNPAGENSYLSLSDTRRRNTAGVNNQSTDPNRNRSTNSHSPPAAAKNNEQNGNTHDEEAAKAGAGGDAPLPQINVIKSTSFFEEGGLSDEKLYVTRGRARGVLVLFSYTEFGRTDYPRLGALTDHNNLKYLFTELGFKVLSYLNLTLKETLSALDNLSKPDQLCSARPECVFVAFASHGYQRWRSSDTELRCADGQLLSIYNVIEYFSHEHFPALQGIPKVFIFQTCRGSQDEPLGPPRHLSIPAGAGRARGGGGGGGAHVYTDGTPMIVEQSKGNRSYSDILLAHSTVPGYVSHRDEAAGSWYIQALCHVFAARAHDTHVKRLFTLVDEYMQQHFHSQTTSVDSWGFNKRLYLHPGLYED